MSNKVLVLLPNLQGPGGVTNLYNALDLKQYANLDYFYVNNAKPQNTLSTIIRLSFNYLKFIFLLVTKRYRLVHLNPSLDKKSFYRDALFAGLAGIFNRKCLVFFHGWDEQFENKIRSGIFKQTIFNRTYSRAQSFIVLGEVFKKKLCSMGVDANKTFYLETTVADDNCLERLNLDEKLDQFNHGPIRFLFISRILKAKGIYIALDAYQQICAHYPNKEFEFIIAGTGPELPQVELYIKQKNLERVTITGYIRDEAKAEVLARSHIMIFPTFHGEGLPNCVLEGMLFGMPIISRIVAAIPDVVKNEVNGFLTESLDPAIFAEKTMELIDNPERYRQMAQINYSYAKENFTPEKVRNRILKIYDGFEAKI